MKTQQDRDSHLMLFCALLMVKNSTATLQQSMDLIPALAKNKNLARELGGSPAAPESDMPRLS